MKTQTKSVYTRRFNELKELIRAHFDDSVLMTDTASLRWSSEACIVAHDGSLGFTLYFENELGDVEALVQIAKTPYCSKSGLIGIHVRETDFAHLLDQIDTALAKGFESIYVESIASLKKQS